MSSLLIQVYVDVPKLSYASASSATDRRAASASQGSVRFVKTLPGP